MTANRTKQATTATASETAAVTEFGCMKALDVVILGCSLPLDQPSDAAQPAALRALRGVRRRTEIRGADGVRAQVGEDVRATGAAAAARSQPGR